MSRPPGSGPNDDPHEAHLRFKVKDQLRKRMGAIRRTLSDDARAKRTLAISERVSAVPAFERARWLAGFVPFRSEASPIPLMDDARKRGCRIALPRVDAEAQTLSLHAYEEGDPLEESGFGIHEPRVDAPQIAFEDVDFVIVPALAVDARGYRVGYGKGFYDRLLPSLPRAVSCVIAFDFQLIAEVPDTPGDWPVDLVATDERLLVVRERS